MFSISTGRGFLSPRPVGFGSALGKPRFQGEAAPLILARFGDPASQLEIHRLEGVSEAFYERITEAVAQYPLLLKEILKTGGFKVVVAPTVHEGLLAEGVAPRIAYRYASEWAYCFSSEPGFRLIVLAQERHTLGNIRGIVNHEFGHGLDACLGLRQEKACQDAYLQDVREIRGKISRRQLSGPERREVESFLNDHLNGPGFQEALAETHAWHFKGGGSMCHGQFYVNDPKSTLFVSCFRNLSRYFAGKNLIPSQN